MLIDHISKKHNVTKRENVKTKEETRRELEVIFERCFNTRWTDCSEMDTITKFVHPLLQSLGWDILSLNEIREEVFAKTSGRDRFIDIVLYSDGKPYVGIEVKSLSYGSIGNETKDNVKYLVERLLEKSECLGTKYSVLTRFVETIIFDSADHHKLALFQTPSDYRKKFDVLWECLSKPL